MWYATHCVGPVAGLIGKPAEYVSCFGSGSIREELVERYGSPFAVETAHIKFLDSRVGGRIIRSLFDTARQYRESIDVYGSRKAVEWPLVEHEPLVVHTAKRPEPDIPSGSRAPTSPTGCRPASPRTRRTGSTTPASGPTSASPRAAATAAATPTWSTSLRRRWWRDAIRSPTLRSQRTGPVWDSAPTSRH
jgi:hypothetical protein